MVLNIKLYIPEYAKSAGQKSNAKHKICVSEALDNISKLHIQMIRARWEKS